MPLKPDIIELIDNYCTKDLPGDLQWHIDRFSFIQNTDLQNKIGRAHYSSRYMSKLMEALRGTGDELHPFVKFQILQYASIYEAVITYLLWDTFKEHDEVIQLQTHKTYKPVHALGSKTSIKYDGEDVFTCVYRDEKTHKNSISFPSKVDCAVRIGFLNEKYAEDIKHIYMLRNLAHIETEADKKIEVEIEHSKLGYWRLRPFLDDSVAYFEENNS